MALVVTSAPWQQVNMPALDLRRYLGVGIQEGVVGSGDMAVAQRGAGANYSVDIAAGEAVIQGDTVTNQGRYYVLNDAVFNLTGFTTANATNPRIDRVTLRVRDAFHGDAANDISFQIVTGTATSGATLVNLNGAAAVPASSVLLANILIPANATTITTANIDTTVRPRIFNPGSGVITSAMLAAGSVLPASLASSIPYVYDRVTSTVDVANTVTETSIYTKSITGNDMGTNRMLRLYLTGDFLHNNVAGDTLTWKVKFGGTTFIQDAQQFGAGTSANRLPWRLDLRIANLAATNSQMIEALHTLSATTAAITTGIGDITVGNGAAAEVAISTLGTIDTTANQTLDVTVTWSAASANNSHRMRYGLLELV